MDEIRNSHLPRPDNIFESTIVEECALLKSCRERIWRGSAIDQTSDLEEKLALALVMSKTGYLIQR